MGRESKSMMGTVGTVPVHWLVAVAMVYALALAPSTTLVAAGPGVVAAVTASMSATASAVLPDCETECNSEASCGTECEYPEGESWIFTTCGEFDGGGEDYCNGNTCEGMCGPHAPAAWECWEDFEPSSCYEQEDYAVCGDDICALYYGAESWATCEDDCGSAPPSPTCGANGCELGETYMNCPADCTPPPASGDECGNDECETTEDDWNCPVDCLVPGLSCSTVTCPSGYDCIDDKQCVHESYVSVGAECQPTQQNPSGCGVGQVCVGAYEAFGPDLIYVCLPWQIT